MSPTTRLSPGAAVGLGLVVSAMGVLVMLLAAGMIPGGDASLEAPRWVVAGAGLMFVLLGAALIVGYARWRAVPGPMATYRRARRAGHA